MRVRQIRKIDESKLRNMCIKNNWYTVGNNEEYADMFKMCQRDNISTQWIYKIAKNIYEHTDIHSAKQGCSPEYSDSDNILNMMIYINDCTYVFYQMTE